MIRPVFIVNPCGALSLVPRNRAFLSLVTTIHYTAEDGPIPKHIMLVML